MRLLMTTLMSWVSVSVVYSITLSFDGLRLNFENPQGFLALYALVALIVAIYYAIVGGPILYVLMNQSRISRGAFIFAGILASLPMLVFCIHSGEMEWIIATIISSVMGGAVYAFRLPNQSST